MAMVAAAPLAETAAASLPEGRVEAGVPALPGRVNEGEFSYFTIEYTSSNVVAAIILETIFMFLGSVTRWTLVISRPPSPKLAG